MYPNDPNYIPQQTPSALEPITAPPPVPTVPENNTITGNNRRKIFIISGVILLIALIVLGAVLKVNADAAASEYVNSSNFQLRKLVYEDERETRLELTKNYEPLKTVFLGDILSSKYRQVHQELQPRTDDIFKMIKKDLAATEVYRSYTEEVMDATDGIVAFSSSRVVKSLFLTDDEMEKVILRLLERAAGIKTMKSTLNKFEAVRQHKDYNQLIDYLDKFAETQQIAVRVFVDTEGPGRQWSDQQMKDFQKTPLINGEYNKQAYDAKIAENKEQLTKAVQFIYLVINDCGYQLSNEAYGLMADARRDKLNQDVISLRENLRTFLNN